MPQIQFEKPKEQKKKEPKVGNKTVVSAYSEEGKRRIARQKKLNILFGILAVLVLVAGIAVLTVLIITGKFSS